MTDHLNDGLVCSQRLISGIPVLALRVDLPARRSEPLPRPRHASIRTHDRVEASGDESEDSSVQYPGENL